MSTRIHIFFVPCLLWTFACQILATDPQFSQLFAFARQQKQGQRSERVSRTLVFYPAFSLRACMYTTLLRQTSQESEGKRVPSVIRMSTCCFVCPGLHARYTDVFNVFLSCPFLDVNIRGIPFSCTRRYTDGGFGCCSGYGKVWRSSVFRLQQW